MRALGITAAFAFLLASSAEATCQRYRWEHFQSSLPSTPIPQFFVCDLETELATVPIPLEADLAYTKDSDKFWKRTFTAWVEVGAGGGGGAATTEPFVTYSATGGLSAERVISNGVNTTVNTSVANQVSIDLSGTHADSFHSDSYSGIGACGANTVATTLNDNAAPTCSALTDAYIPDTITVSNYLPLAGGTLTGNLVLSGDANEGLSGGGLTDCDADNQTVSWDSTTNKFGCGDDDTGGGGASHALMDGSVHNDTVAAVGNVGSLIVGQGGGVPLWIELAMGTGSQVLRVNPTGTNIQWALIATANIADDQVTFAKTQNISSGSFLGRTSLGSGDIEELASSASLRGVLVDEVGTGPALFASTSAELRTALSDETGTGAAIFGITSAMADDIACAAGQAIRRNSADNAWECFNAPNIEIKRLAANSAVNVIAKQNLTGLSFTLAANTNYSISCIFTNTSNAAAVGVQYGATFGGTITSTTWVLEHFASTTTKTPLSDSSFPIDLNPLTSQGVGGAVTQIEANIEVSGTGGTLQLTHGSETATLTTTLRGSFCRLIRY